MLVIFFSMSTLTIRRDEKKVQRSYVFFNPLIRRDFQALRRPYRKEVQLTAKEIRTRAFLNSRTNLVYAPGAPAHPSPFPMLSNPAPPVMLIVI